MRQRLGLAASLLREPQLLARQATNGLDPAACATCAGSWSVSRARGSRPALSHLFAEVEEICNRVAIIRRGEIAYEGTLADLRASAGSNRYRLRTTDNGRAHQVLLEHAEAADVILGGDELTFSTAEAEVGAVACARRRGTGNHRAVPEQLSLESFFFELTEGEQPAEAA